MEKNQLPVTAIKVHPHSIPLYQLMEAVQPATITLWVMFLEYTLQLQRFSQEVLGSHAPQHKHCLARSDSLLIAHGSKEVVSLFWRLITMKPGSRTFNKASRSWISKLLKLSLSSLFCWSLIRIILPEVAIPNGGSNHNPPASCMPLLTSPVLCIFEDVSGLL